MESAFQECLDYVEVKDVLDAVAGRISLASQLPAHFWEASEHFRPTIPEKTDTAFGNVSSYMFKCLDLNPRQLYIEPCIQIFLAI